MKTYIAEFTDKNGNQVEVAEFKGSSLNEAKQKANLYKRHEVKVQCSTSVRLKK
jgi:hypothetical protein